MSKASLNQGQSGDRCSLWGEELHKKDSENTFFFLNSSAGTISLNIHQNGFPGPTHTPTADNADPGEEWGLDHLYSVEPANAALSPTVQGGQCKVFVAQQTSQVMQ